MDSTHTRSDYSRLYLGLLDSTWMTTGLSRNNLFFVDLFERNNIFLKAAVWVCGGSKKVLSLHKNSGKTSFFSMCGAFDCHVRIFTWIPKAYFLWVMVKVK